MTHRSDTYWQRLLPGVHATLTTRSDPDTIGGVFPRVRCPGSTQRSPIGLSPDSNGVPNGVFHRAHSAIHQTVLLHWKKCGNPLGAVQKRQTWAVKSLPSHPVAVMQGTHGLVGTS